METFAVIIRQQLFSLRSSIVRRAKSARSPYPATRAVSAWPRTSTRRLLTVPFNTKAWRHRDDFAPVAGANEKAALLAAWRAGRHPSLEVLVPNALPLAGNAVALHTASATEADWLRAFRAETGFGLAAGLPLIVSPDLFPPGPEPDLSAHAGYLRDCRTAGTLLTPPDLPFD